MAFTEFYCHSLGSNLNGGSSNAANATFTSNNGNWTSPNFRPRDGQNPFGNANVGDFASIFADGATVGVYITRISAVQNAVNGNITIDTTNFMGAAPATNVTRTDIRVAGAWRGPNG